MYRIIKAGERKGAKGVNCRGLERSSLLQRCYSFSSLERTATWSRHTIAIGFHHDVSVNDVPKLDKHSRKDVATSQERGADSTTDVALSGSSIVQHRSFSSKATPIQLKRISSKHRFDLRNGLDRLSRRSYMERPKQLVMTTALDIEKPKEERNVDYPEEDPFTLPGREFYMWLQSVEKPKDFRDGWELGKSKMLMGCQLPFQIRDYIVSDLTKAIGVPGWIYGATTSAYLFLSMPLAGFIVGMYQIGRGVLNTPEAIKSRSKGMFWDADDGKWFFYNLDTHLLSCKSIENDSCGIQTSDADYEFEGRFYYRLLRVSSSASHRELREAYYREAGKVHPDTNPNDVSAANRFQALGRAFQVLSDPVARTNYDGHLAFKPTCTIDPSLLFAIVFGSEASRPYTGNLLTAEHEDSILRKTAAEPNDTLEIAKLRNTQQRREVECAMHLWERIAPLVQGKQDKESLIKSSQKEANVMAQASVGDLYCKTIGLALEAAANEFITQTSSVMDSFEESLQVGEAEVVDDEIAKAIELFEASVLPLLMTDGSLDESSADFLERIWLTNFQDISRTLRGSVVKVLNHHPVDRQLSSETKLQRAEAIRLVGRAFLSVGTETSVQSRYETHAFKDVTSPDTYFQGFAVWGREEEEEEDFGIQQKQVAV